MTDRDNLQVWHDRQPVGRLWRDEQDRLGFQYDSSWFAQGGFPISQSLPRQEEAFAPSAGIAQRFFANLLPEGGARERLVRELGIADSHFNLLHAIGGECAGALSIMPAGAAHPDDHGEDAEPLSEAELARLVARQGRFLAEPDGQYPRLSLAGTQDKCPILLRDDTFLKPGRSQRSSHILKFEVPNYRNVPVYETFTTMLAEAIGLPVVQIQLRSLDSLRYTLIARYDRIKTPAGTVEALHQEDFCQALGLGHQQKYQQDSGPSFADCYRLLRDVSADPGNDLQQLLRWQIFNVLAGNSDGHAKNLSLLYHPDGEIRLAPFYDLVCTRAIKRLDERLAFAVGDESKPALISPRHWDDMARQCDLRPSFLRQLVEKTAAELLKKLAPTRQAFTERYGEYPALQRVKAVVTKQCRRVAA